MTNTNPYTAHKNQECSCYKTDIKTNCTYAKFPDGWDFTPDVGNGQKRGEIFTPLWVVQKMIVDSGMLPKEGVYTGDYSAPSEIALKCINARVNEPAVGTANYTSTILYHKLQYAKVEALYPNNQDTKRRPSSSKKLTKDQIPYYHQLLLTAIASLYAFDIDAGNLQTTKQRLLGDKTPLDSQTNKNYWTNYIKTHLKTALNQAQLEEIRNQVDESLEQAQTNWGKFTNSGKSVIDNAYKEATGKELPAKLRKTIQRIIDSNILLFNGIKAEDSIDNFYVPGTNNVEWTWWEFSRDQDEIIINTKTVSLKDQLRKGRLREIEKLLETSKGDERTRLLKEKHEIEFSFINTLEFGK